MIEQIGFHLDMARCTGCKTCMIACKDKHDTDLSVNWRRVVEYGGGGWKQEGLTFRQTVFAYYLSVACNHCRDPICVESCPTTAMHKGEQGIVAVDSTKCMGCRYCEWGCPYGAPQFDSQSGRMTKCDFCRDYLKQGRDPACVAACPTRALSYGELDLLAGPDEADETVRPLPSPRLTNPALSLAVHRSVGQAADRPGDLANPEEI